jgi:hypothetical protein
MDAQLKAKWIEALRSGEYVQATGLFENCPDANGYDPKAPHGFCCLGVLCKTAGEPVLLAEGSNWKFVRDQIGNPTDTLVSLNDGGKSFSEIAEWIEANL